MDHFFPAFKQSKNPSIRYRIDGARSRGIFAFLPFYFYLD